MNTPEEDYNPSVRGTKRFTSRIVRCPKKSSKVSLSTCEKCNLNNGIGDSFIICSYQKKRKR